MTNKIIKLGQPVFLCSLLLLILNDWLFKILFHNFITGKLSDFAGLFAFPFFWSALFPKKSKEIHLFTSLFFIFWKSSFSDAFVNFVGAFRVVDFSDNIALISVFVSFQLSKKEYFALKLNPKILQLIMLLSCFSFVATTQKREPCNTIECDFLNLSLINETDKKIVVLIDFKYSEKEIELYKKQQILDNINFRRKVLEERHERHVGESDSFKPSDSIEIIRSINDNWAARQKASIIAPLNLDIHSSTTILLPLSFYDTLIGFPKNFKMTILDSNLKPIKIYDKKAFFDKINQNATTKLDEYLRPNNFTLLLGEIKKPLVISNCYGKWESKGNGNFSKIEFNSQHFINDKTGDVYNCEYKNDTIYVYTPNKTYAGILKNTKDNEIVISWNKNEVVTYKKSLKPTTLSKC